MKPVIWTIGHSTRSLEEFLELLRVFKIELLADVRSFPGSKKFPHFNKENLAPELKRVSVSYVHYPDLGGRRKVLPDSANTAWKNKSFQGYADYMSTAPFNNGISMLCDAAKEKRTAYMCSEAVWWRCHRSLISDYLKVQGWNVMHILSATHAEPHPYTSPAKVIQGDLFYQ